MSKFEKALRNLTRTIAGLAANRCDLAKVTRATDAAYRLARFEENPGAAGDEVSAARAGLEAAIETARDARTAGYRAEALRLRAEHREEMRNGPTAWMREPARF